MRWAEGTPQRCRYFQPGSLQASLWGTPWQLPFRIAPRCHQRWRRNGSGLHPQLISWLNVYNSHYINPQLELEFWTNLVNHGDHVMQLSVKDGDLRGRSLFQWRFIAGKIFLKPNKGFFPLQFLLTGGKSSITYRSSGWSFLHMAEMMICIV